MAHFKLVPPEQESAISQLFRCAAMATSVLLKSHGWYKLYGEYRDELFDRVRDDTVRHFLEFKIGHHTYARKAADGRPLDFSANVLSSCYSVCSNVANHFLKELSRRNLTNDIEPFKYGLGEKDGLPRYLSRAEMKYTTEHVPINKMVRGMDRARVIKEMYDDYLYECEFLGIPPENRLELGPWAVRNGWGNDSDMFFYLESKEDREELLRGQARWLLDQEIAKRDAEEDPSYLKKKVYQREYFRRKRTDARLAKSKEFEKLYGPPEPGKLWVERNGKICQVKERL